MGICACDDDDDVRWGSEKGGPEATTIVKHHHLSRTVLLLVEHHRTGVPRECVDLGAFVKSWAKKKERVLKFCVCTHVKLAFSSSSSAAPSPPRNMRVFLSNICSYKEIDRERYIPEEGTFICPTITTLFPTIFSSFFFTLYLLRFSSFLFFLNYFLLALLVFHDDISAPSITSVTAFLWSILMVADRPQAVYLVGKEYSKGR